jgi:hypothetical protein
MSSITRPQRSATVPALEVWNRRIHFYLGLYFLVFLWLFALTGWMLNHGRWLMSMSANERRETKYERLIDPPRGNTDLARAQDVMRQLDLVGEINWPTTQQPGTLSFNVSRPREANQLRLDLARNTVAVQHFDNTHLAMFRILHTFSGSRYTDSAERDWILTTVWVTAMDAVAAGLVAMVLGSYYMWWRLKKKRALGLIVLASGVTACAVFVAALL